MITSSDWKIYGDKIRSQNMNFFLFVMSKTYQYRDHIFFLGVIRTIGSTDKLYISEFLNNFFMEYTDVFSDDIPAILSSKRQVDYKMKLILGSTPICKAPHCLTPKKLEKCKTKNG